jgi:hypothetical protein
MYPDVALELAVVAEGHLAVRTPELLGPLFPALQQLLLLQLGLVQQPSVFLQHGGLGATRHFRRVAPRAERRKQKRGSRVIG